MTSSTALSVTTIVIRIAKFGCNVIQRIYPLAEHCLRLWLCSFRWITRVAWRVWLQTLAIIRCSICKCLLVPSWERERESEQSERNTKKRGPINVWGCIGWSVLLYGTSSLCPENFKQQKNRRVQSIPTIKWGADVHQYIKHLRTLGRATKSGCCCCCCYSLLFFFLASFVYAQKLPLLCSRAYFNSQTHIGKKLVGMKWQFRVFLFREFMRIHKFYAHFLHQR